MYFGIFQAVREIKNNYADLSVHQRRWLKVNPEDMMGSFIYEIGMMFDDETGKHNIMYTLYMWQGTSTPELNCAC